LLKVEDVSFSYGMIQVLWNISFEAHEKEITVVIGPNGAGKSTLVSLIAGINKPKAGTILFNNEKIDSLPAYSIVKKGISLVPEGRRVFPQMSVHENLLMGAYPVTDGAQIRRSTEQVYQIFPILKDKRRNLAKTMSGGEQQMLVIARGLMSNPRLLILDEPSLGLAPIMVEKMLDAITQINENGVTVLLVEQNIRESLDISDRCYVLENGRIVRSGDSRELLADSHIKEVYLGF
jgi:branched-chain amino acid transport system ATP-binding protein